MSDVFEKTKKEAADADKAQESRGRYMCCYSGCPNIGLDFAGYADGLPRYKCIFHAECHEPVCIPLVSKISAWEPIKALDEAIKKILAWPLGAEAELTAALLPGLAEKARFLEEFSAEELRRREEELSAELLVIRPEEPLQAYANRMQKLMARFVNIKAQKLAVKQGKLKEVARETPRDVAAANCQRVLDMLAGKIQYEPAEEKKCA